MVGSMFVFTLNCESIFIQTLSCYIVYVCISVCLFLSLSVSPSLPPNLSLCVYVRMSVHRFTLTAVSTILVCRILIIMLSQSCSEGNLTHWSFSILQVCYVIVYVCT